MEGNLILVSPGSRALSILKGKAASIFFTFVCTIDKEDCGGNLKLAFNSCSTRQGETIIWKWPTEQLSLKVQ